MKIIRSDQDISGLTIPCPSSAGLRSRPRACVTPLRSILKRLMCQLPLLMALSSPNVIVSAGVGSRRGGVRHASVMHAQRLLRRARLGPQGLHACADVTKRRRPARLPPAGRRAPRPAPRAPGAPPARIWRATSKALARDAFESCMSAWRLRSALRRLNRSSNSSDIRPPGASDTGDTGDEGAQGRRSGGSKPSSRHAIHPFRPRQPCKKATAARPPASSSLLFP